MARQYIIQTPNGPVVVNETGNKQATYNTSFVSETQNAGTTPVTPVVRRRRASMLICS